jgi:hypothetical protein
VTGRPISGAIASMVDIPEDGAKPLRRRGNSGSFRPDQFSPADCASSFAISRRIFATWRRSLRAGPGFSRRASTRKSLAYSSQVEDVSVDICMCAMVSLHRDHR